MQPSSTVPRADVAGVTAAVLEYDGTIGRQWELVQNGLLIVEAIAVALLAELGLSSRWASRQ